MNLSQIPKKGFRSVDLIFYTIQQTNQRLLVEYKPMDTPDKIKHACEVRLGLFQPYIAHWPEVTDGWIDRSRHCLSYNVIQLMSFK
jgi:hypothetical protein